MTDLIARLRDYAANGSRPWLGIETVFTEAADEIAALRDRHRRTMSDTQRLIWRDDVEGICPTPDMCFEYGEHVRCGPCAIKQATACGVASDLSLPNLPEVSRQHREIAALRARVAELTKANREAVELIDEINERATSRKFWGISQTIHAKLCTIRITLARAILSKQEPEYSGWVEVVEEDRGR